ncbi:MAG: lipase family protein [Gemmatales bacterium]
MNFPVAVCGYSEGGCAAGWALQLQPFYAPDLPIVAGAAGGVPADLTRPSTASTGAAPSRFCCSTPPFGLDSAYPEIDLKVPESPQVGASATSILRRPVVRYPGRIPVVGLANRVPLRRISRRSTILCSDAASTRTGSARPHQACPCWSARPPTIRPYPFRR